MAFEVIIIVTNFGLWQVKTLEVNVYCCSPTLNVYCDIISGHAHKQLSCTKPLAPLGNSTRTKLNLKWGIFESKISQLFLHHNILFHLAQLYICGNSRHSYLSKVLKLAKCHIHWAFKLTLHTLSGKLRIFHGKMQRQLNFFAMKPNNTHKFHSKKFLMSYFWKKSC